jgi:hypothetical protein
MFDWQVRLAPSGVGRCGESLPPADPVVSVEPVTSDQTGLNLVVETPLSARHGALWN